MNLRKITDQNNSFIDVLRNKDNISLWTENWLIQNGNDIEFWDNGNVVITESEIKISGGNGIITLNIINK